MSDWNGFVISVAGERGGDGPPDSEMSEEVDEAAEKPPDDEDEIGVEFDSGAMIPEARFAVNDLP